LVSTQICLANTYQYRPLAGLSKRGLGGPYSHSMVAGGLDEMS
jgi:hypothetical protein